MYQSIALPNDFCFAVDEKSARLVTETLARVESILKEQSFIAGEQFSEADIRLFTTIIRYGGRWQADFGR